jgi:hypothetical protein
MIKNVVSEIGGVGLYGVISICLFVTVFTGALVWAWRLKKPFLKTMSGLPLEDGSVRPETKGAIHE